MTADQWQAERFEEHRAHLRAVAYRMLGSGAEADDAVQEAWLRLSRSDADAVENLRGWLTTVVGRICLDMLRTRRARREEPLDEQPAAALRVVAGPEQEALLADAVGAALLVVLETLSPAERLAFVLHDTFGVPFEEIAPIVDRSVPATRQLASRARRRVRGAAPAPRAESTESLAAQQEVVAAFLAAAREGDFDALVAVLDPDVRFRADRGAAGAPGPVEVTGAPDVARVVLERGARFAPLARPAIVGTQAGAMVVVNGRLISVLAFTVGRGRITGIDLTLDPEKLRRVRI
jgi:RNA polymerase sigma factor (sigma-70 family)